MADRKLVKSEAGRSSRVSGRWFAAPFVILLSGGLAVLMLGLLYDGSGPMPWTAAAGAACVLVGGGVLAGVVVGAHVSQAVFAAALFVPLPTVLIAFVLMAGLSQSEADLPETVLITFLLYALWEVPIVATLGVRSSVQGRASERLPSMSPGPPPFEPELKAATKAGRAITVVRVYLDGNEGRSHLEADKIALVTYGYEFVSVESRPLWGTLKRLTWGLVLWWIFDDPDHGAARIVATFKRPDLV